MNRFDVYLINLDERPTKDPKNTRPAVVISPDELNRHVETVIIAPLSSTNVRYPTRIDVEFLNSTRSVILDQLRAVEKKRLVKKIGNIDADSQARVITSLQELFAK